MEYICENNYNKSIEFQSIFKMEYSIKITKSNTFNQHRENQQVFFGTNGVN